MTRLLLAALVLFSGCSSANWTRADTVRQTAIVALQVVDWGQTRTIATEMVPQHVDLGNGASVTYAEPRYRYCENNPFLGEHPTVGQVNTFFVASIVGNALISYLLPPEWRAGWQYVSIGYQAGFVVNNFNAGIRW